ncbi:MAG: hypothetical protein R3D90_02575 [Paracoccaceae bacterium]
MTGEADETDEGIRRALDAAQAANDAAQDMAELSAAHRAFAEAVMQGQRRNTMLAAGAAAGAAVALVLGGLVYFRSVADLRDAAAVQGDAAKLLVEELKLIDGIGDTVAEQQAVMKTDLLATLETVKDEVRRAAMSAAAPEPAPPAAEMEAQMAQAIRDGVKTDMEAMRDEILTALAEMEMEMAGGGATPAEMTELLAGVKALVAAGGGGDAAAGSARPAKPKAKPKAKPAAAVSSGPDPFTYP